MYLFYHLSICLSAEALSTLGAVTVSLSTVNPVPGLCLAHRWCSINIRPPHPPYKAWGMVPKLWTLVFKTERKEVKPVPGQGHILRKRQRAMSWPLPQAQRHLLKMPGVRLTRKEKGPAWPEAAHSSLGAISRDTFIPLPWAAAGPLPHECL